MVSSIGGSAIVSSQAATELANGEDPESRISNSLLSTREKDGQLQNRRDEQDEMVMSNSSAMRARKK